MHEIEAPRGNCRGVFIGKLLRFRIDAGLTGIDQPEEACLDLRVDFSEDCIALLDSGLLLGAREEAMEQQRERFRLEEIRGWCDGVTHIGPWLSLADHLVREENREFESHRPEILSYEYNITCFGCRHGQQVWGIEADGRRGARRGDASRLLGV